MNTNAKRKVYVSPKVEVHDVEVTAMLAASFRASTESTETMTVEDWSGASEEEHSSEVMIYEDWSGR